MVPIKGMISAGLKEAYFNCNFTGFKVEPYKFQRNIETQTFLQLCGYHRVEPCWLDSSRPQLQGMTRSDSARGTRLWQEAEKLAANAGTLPGGAVGRGR